MFNYVDNAALYSWYEAQRAMISPLNLAAGAMQRIAGNPMNPAAHTHYGKTTAAALQVFERITRNYGRPEFGIVHTMMGSSIIPIKQRTVKKKTFCDLLHFAKPEASKKQPKLLIVAPMSGHYPTLLRGTVEASLPFFDTYITDWQNPRDIPLAKGDFDLDDYINYVIDFIKVLGPNVHVMAVCQPAVPVLAAVSIMAGENDPKQPKSMILIGGPIDARKSPTMLNNMATEKPTTWFEKHVITRVPFNYLGFMRKVYPGFIQLSGFIKMNLNRHVNAHFKFFRELVRGDGEGADAHRKFYNEYLSVMDLPAEFYLQTVQAVFKDFSLPDGKMVSRGRKVDPKKIKKTALLCIEGELDDISGIGQTKAAIPLCASLPANKKKYHMQKGVGHYGSFHGRKFREHIMPVIVDWAKKAES